jgi:hypothetical protein
LLLFFVICFLGGDVDLGGMDFSVCNMFFIYQFLHVWCDHLILYSSVGVIHCNYFVCCCRNLAGWVKMEWAEWEALAEWAEWEAWVEWEAWAEWEEWKDWEEWEDWEEWTSL